MGSMGLDPAIIERTQAAVLDLPLSELVRRDIIAQLIAIERATGYEQAAQAFDYLSRTLMDAGTFVDLEELGRAMSHWRLRVRRGESL